MSSSDGYSTITREERRNYMDRRLFNPPLSPFFHRRFFDDFDFDRPFTRPYWNDHSMMTGHKIGEGLDLVDNEKEYSVSIDTSQFEPEELKVNIVDNVLVIEGKHAEKTDRFGQVERHFVRKYVLPASVKPEEITSELSKEGVLTVKYDKKPEAQPKTIPITITPKKN